MFALLLLVLLLGVFLYSRVVNRLRGLPPGPPPLPLIGNLLHFEPCMDKKFLSWKQRYGGVFTVWMPQPVVVIGDYKILQDSIIREGDNFGDRKLNEVFNKMMMGGNYGLAFQDNSIWRAQRRFALHTLRDLGSGTSRLQSAVISYAHELIGRWGEKGTRPFDVKDDVMSAVANMMWHLTFGKTLPIEDTLIRKVRRFADEFNANFCAPLIAAMEHFPSIASIDALFNGPITRFMAAAHQQRAIVDGEIAEVEENLDGAPPCYVEAFLREQRRLGEGEGSFTRQQMVAASLALWAAGFDTTVTTLRFCIHYAMSYPDVQTRMQEEIDSVVGKRDLTMDDQKSLHYCNAVLQEVQRFVNVLPINFFRLTSSDTMIDGYQIPAGTTVLPQFQIVHSDPSQFDRPDYFCPSRHLDGDGSFVKDPRITPFSVGKRACLGEGLARMELFLFFCSFVQHLRFSSPSLVPPPIHYLVGFGRSIAEFDVVVTPRN